jgi:hypothetical protein
VQVPTAPACCTLDKVKPTCVARAVDAAEAVEQPWQMIGDDRHAPVVHHHLHLLRFGRRGHGDHRRRAWRCKPGGIAQQVRQRAPDQRRVRRQRGVPFDAQGRAGVCQRGHVERADLGRQPGHRPQAAAHAPARAKGHHHAGGQRHPAASDSRRHHVAQHQVVATAIALLAGKRLSLHRPAMRTTA